MKYSEAEEKIKALSSKYSVKLDKFSDTFKINYKNEEVAYVHNYERYSLTIWSEKHFSKLPFSNKLYMILSELAMTPLDERVEEKKYYIKIFDNKFGYLNIDILTDNMMVYDRLETEFVKTKFTDKAIKQLKQRDDIPLDWNKVLFKEV